MGEQKNPNTIASPPVPPHEVYRTHMLEFKLRLEHCERISSASSPATGLQALDSEFCFLQIRRMVEIIAFSSVIRDESRYKRLREMQRENNNRDHGDHSKDWNAIEILQRLAQISPYCLPIPLKSKVTKHGKKVEFDRKNISVTHGRLIEVYKICGGYLHAKKPFNNDYNALVAEERQKYECAPVTIKKCLSYFRELMWYHAAVGLSWAQDENPKAPADPKSAWLIDFGGESQNTINIILAEAIS
jgi:hypothetical protein